MHYINDFAQILFFDYSPLPLFNWKDLQISYFRIPVTNVWINQTYPRSSDHAHENLLTKYG